ncbi:dihydroxyacetone kinase subunit DhaK [Rhodococcus sp. PAMC28707]|uniref:dihydroxyacetone kinase family protein n=1 Tax=unclassified Rhodococcus (in: high G+C Gram-positive bacteria) TaxID=192944 RepID=UPI00109DF6BC|nr:MULTISPECIES: dihydroxyacetone kinase family protein [unclassified Rhodococcus (in: high G+C Gram-positive bacteria)]QCB52481.1 dihydroxyacetone kinase subunit DhaK [Rhodococcus sp. PAMC28705]QCB60967.1 dihydroxyacetone kinase subunit DhaK [Rhodococcus sp. PAMC28707]
MFVNSADMFVADAIRGLVASTGDIAWHPDPGFLSRRDRIPQGQVALLSGGGSGHEPMHAGFIGEGMLTAVCPGLVFSSPNALQVHEASKAISAGGGVLHIVKNYTGDVMNFHIARELLREDGIETDFVLVDDDVATERSDGDGPGRRGTAATVVVEKVCGAAAQRGDSLDVVAALGRRVVSNSRSMAVALSPCTLPGSASPSFDLPEDEIELGIGIHGERGTSRVPTMSAREIVAELAGAVVASLALERGATVLAFVNGLGGTHPLELHLLFGELAECLSDKGITVTRALVGSFVTALNMAGASITLVHVDEEILQLWDAPTSAPGWPNAAQSEFRGVGERGGFGPGFTPSVTSSETSVFVGKWVSSWVRRVLDEEPALTDLDRRAGDGDFGTNMAAALRRLDLDSIREELPAATVFEAVSEAYLGHAGGTSGALFGLWFRQFYRELGETVDLDAIVRAARHGLDSITELGGAQVGDKTMVDAIAPAVAALEEATSLVAGLHAAAVAATGGAASTSELTANRGRASYVGEAARGVTDPGALVIAWYFEAASEAAESVLAQ